VRLAEQSPANSSPGSDARVRPTPPAWASRTFAAAHISERVRSGTGATNFDVRHQLGRRCRRPWFSTATFTNDLQSRRRRCRRKRCCQRAGLRAPSRPKCQLRPSPHLAGAPRRGAGISPARNAEALCARGGGREPLWCSSSPSCQSAVREDAPALLRGPTPHGKGAQSRREWAVLFEVVSWTGSGHTDLALSSESVTTILLHGHCHQKSHGRSSLRGDAAARSHSRRGTLLEFLGTPAACSMAGFRLRLPS
jgi:hypothetical protein